MSGALLFLAALAMGNPSQEPEEGRLEAAFVRVVIEGSYATVMAQYEVDRSGAPLVFEAPRLPGQIVILDRAFGPDGVLEVAQLVEVRRITAPASTPGPAQFRVSYRVEDDFSRIPVFVPGVRSAPGTSPVRLEIIGAPADVDPENAVPPFRRGPGGALSATTPDLPAVILLPSPAQGRYPTWVFAWTAVFVVCLAAVVWVAHRAWSARNRAPGAV
jgi:hypothetical protein